MTDAVEQPPSEGAAASGEPELKSRPLRMLLREHPGPDRILYHNIWFRGHNNPRYAALLPRLSRLDPYLATCSAHRVVRGVQYRALIAARGARNKLVMGAGRRRYRALLTTDMNQVPRFAGPSVADVDDPLFTAGEVRLLGHPNLRAYVVTTEAAARRYEALGLDKPWHVVPQGVSLTNFDPRGVAEVAARRRTDGDVVVGYMAAWHVTAQDRGGDNPLYNVDHLFDLWDEIRRRVPRARLWLIGQASDRVAKRAAEREDVTVLGRLPHAEALTHVANFDIALYPRRVDHAPQAAKVIEYMGVGVPTVSYELETTSLLRTTGAGIQVPTPAAFVDAVAALSADGARRAELAAAAHRAGQDLNWDRLAERYEREILDVYLPPA